MKTTLTPAEWWKLLDHSGFEEQYKLVNKHKFNWPVTDEQIKFMFDKFYENFPDTIAIETSHEINIGDTFIYTGEPRGTGMYIPIIGKEWFIENEDNKIALSIEMIERGRGWKKLLNNESC